MSSLSSNLVKVGESIFNLDAIAGMHYEGENLFVHFVGGRFEKLAGVQAEELWTMMEARLAPASATADTSKRVSAASGRKS